MKAPKSAPIVGSIWRDKDPRLVGPNERNVRVESVDPHGFVSYSVVKIGWPPAIGRRSQSRYQRFLSAFEEVA